MRLKHTESMGSPQERARIRKKGSWWPTEPHKEPEAHRGLQQPSGDPQISSVVHLETSKIQSQQSSVCNWQETVFPRFSARFDIFEHCLWLKADSAQLDFWQLCSSRAVFPQFLEVYCHLVATAWQTQSRPALPSCWFEIHKPLRLPSTQTTLF